MRLSIRTATLGLLCAGCCLPAGCAYPRHTTLLNPVPKAAVDAAKAPRDLYSFRLIGAEVPARKISGLHWDSDGTDADTFVRLYIGKRLVWQSEVAKDQQRPAWNVTLPRNLRIPSNTRFRLELWDYDTPVSADPIGHVESMGLPSNALPDAQARLRLNAQSLVTVMVSAPVASQGVGLTVEIHSDYLDVLKVAPYSPASRAGIKVGEHIVQIGPERVAHINDDQAASRISLAADRKHNLMVTDAQGRGEREVVLDGKLVWQLL